MRDYQKVFMNAVFNSFLPEFFDSDEMTSLPPETEAALRKLLDHYYKDEATTQKHIARYEAKGQTTKARFLRSGAINDALVNDYFGTDDFTKNFESQGSASDIKMILGKFSVRRENGGYRITDKYDFSSNTAYLKEYLPEVTETMLEQGYEVGIVRQLQAAVAATEGRDGNFIKRNYPIIRTLAGQLMPAADEAEDGSTQEVNIFISDEDRVNEDFPSPRPTWFEDENVPPVFPDTAMDSERKGLLDTALDALFPPAEAMFATEEAIEFIERKPVPVPQSKPTAKERRIDAAQDQDFSDASA